MFAKNHVDTSIFAKKSCKTHQFLLKKIMQDTSIFAINQTDVCYYQIDT